MVASKDFFSVWRSLASSFCVSIPPDETMMTLGSDDFDRAGIKDSVRMWAPRVLVAKLAWV